MAISITRYIDIISGVAAAETVAERQLIGRLFTDNPLLPPGTFAEFSSSDDVGEYFGTGSSEYLRSDFYFSWVSPLINSAPLISFSRWVDVAQAAVIYGANGAYPLANFTVVANGSLNITLGGFTHQLTAINLSAEANLAAVAAAIQAAIRAYNTGGADWTNATVTYNAVAANGGAQFNLVGGVAGPEPIAVLAATAGTDLAPILGWTTGAVIGEGSAVETITNTLTNSAGASDNFGSFLFMPTLDLAQVTEAATWNDSQNVKFQYCIPTTASNTASIEAAIINLAGNAMCLAPLSDEYPEMANMIIMAATDYTALNAVMNYMFRVFDLTPSVTDDEDANTYDALSANYYGQTQTAGQLIQFYQRGVLTGLPVSPLDQNTYANEQWLKSQITADLMSLELDLPQINAGNQGRANILAVLQGDIQQAKTNGTMSIGKPFTVEEILFVNTVTGDATAWQQVQNQGYWVNVVFVPVVEAGVTTYKAKYTLIYSKDDIIREIDGQDELI